MNDISKQLREYAANPGYSHNDYADTMLAAAAEIERRAAKETSAERTLRRLGYEDRGGELWAPPIGKQVLQSQAQQPTKPFAWMQLVDGEPLRSVALFEREKQGMEDHIKLTYPDLKISWIELFTAPASQAQQESKELGHPYGIVDPDYARIYTQSRIIAWQYGYSCLMHGSFTRDLDLLLVPWEESARDNHDQLLKLIADACGLQFKDGEKEIYKAKVDWTNKPHGRKSCSLFFKEARDRRWIDIAVLPVSPPAPEGGDKQ